MRSWPVLEPHNAIPGSDDTRHRARRRAPSVPRRLASDKSTSGVTDGPAYFVGRYGTTPAKADHDTLIRMIEDAFREGVGVDISSFPKTDKDFYKLLADLRSVSTDDLKAKLSLSSWKLSPQGKDKMRCQECVYFLVHRRWCDLPELDLPTAPYWSCRLWRI